MICEQLMLETEPGVMEHFDMGDLGAMLCPRRLVIQSGKLDPLDGPRGQVNVREQAAITEKAYAACGCPGNMMLDIGEAGHQFYPERLRETAAFLTE